MSIANFALHTDAAKSAAPVSFIVIHQIAWLS
jgi:hypothetical protein